MHMLASRLLLARPASEEPSKKQPIVGIASAEIYRFSSNCPNRPPKTILIVDEFFSHEIIIE
jgi:hypothetical protein